MNKALAYELENSMWTAAKNRDADAFAKIVAPDAVMVCGGYRCTGKEYAQIVRGFDCKAYEITGFEIVHETPQSFQVHYLLRMQVEDPKNLDLAGSFHITTTWQMKENRWQVLFNMDHKID